MTAKVPDTVLEIARQVLTPKQLAVWELETQGYSLRQISHELDLGKSTVQDHLASVWRRLQRAGVTQDGSGFYHPPTTPEA